MCSYIDSSGPFRIKLINATRDTDFKIAICTKNFDPSVSVSQLVAWQVISTQSSSHFRFPKESHVAALYNKDGRELMSGPFEAPLGSTWNIEQEKEDEPALLKHGSR